MKFLSFLSIAFRLITGRGADRSDLARRSLRGAVSGIAISLVPILVVLVVADGMIQGITARYMELASYHKQLVPYYKTNEKELESLVERIRSIEGVTGAWLEIQAFGVAFTKGKSSGAAIRAIDPLFFADSGTKRFLSTTLGNNPETLDSYGAYIGSELAKKLGVLPGDTINLVTLRSDTQAEPKPRISVFIVRGIVSGGYRELDANWFFIHPKAAKRAISTDTSRSIIGIKLRSPFDDRGNAAIVASIKSILPENVSIHDWRDMERNLIGSLGSTRSILLVIMALVVVVATLNVGGSLVTLVMERSNEIAVLKAFGASPGDIGSIFMIIGIVIGGMGAVFGVAAGLLTAVHVNEVISVMEKFSIILSRVVNFILNRPSSENTIHLLNPDYYLQTIPIVLDFWTCALIALATIILSLAFSILPARMAGRLKPLELIRRH